MPRETGTKLIASNKKARHDYAILRTYEAGLVLAGTEVKSLRLGRVSLVDTFAQEHEGEIMLYGLHIAEYGFGSWTNHAPRRTRKLLLHKAEIIKILNQLGNGQAFGCPHISDSGTVRPWSTSILFTMVRSKSCWITDCAMCEARSGAPSTSGTGRGPQPSSATL